MIQYNARLQVMQEAFQELGLVECTPENVRNKQTVYYFDPTWAQKGVSVVYTFDPVGGYYRRIITNGRGRGRVKYQLNPKVNPKVSDHRYRMWKQKWGENAYLNPVARKECPISRVLIHDMALQMEHAYSQIVRYRKNPKSDANYARNYDVVI